MLIEMHIRRLSFRLTNRTSEEHEPEVLDICVCESEWIPSQLGPTAETSLHKFAEHVYSMDNPE
jgi:hypothetical protein